jgi:predicted flap endonuclease-1-like 5' DNA nuclease
MIHQTIRPKIGEFQLDLLNNTNSKILIYMENLKCLFNCFPWDIFIFALLLGLLLWWLLSKLLDDRLKSHASELQDRINFLEGELDACRKSKVSASADIDLGAAANVAAPVAAAAFVAPAAAAAPVSNKKDDLKIVEGIGPKIEELCNNAGIYTFAELAATSAERLKEILDAAGSRFQMHDPTTWPEQSALARDGKWDELKKWQDELNKGKA